MTVTRLVVAAAVAAFGCTIALAQSGNRLTEPAGLPASRWRAEIDQLDQALRERALLAREPRAHWVAGQIDIADPVAQVAHYARARASAPSEKLYVAALATSCLEPVRPMPVECNVPDRLADWATRDTENGVPSLLLADRARLRNDGTAMIAYLEEAALRPRFDDYWNRGALFMWDEVRALPVNVDPAAKAEFAALAASTRLPFTARTLPTLCREALRFGENARAACNAAGAAMAQRGVTWALRTTGAQMAQRNAATPQAQADAERRLAEVRSRAYACAEAGNPVATAFASPDAAIRGRALEQWETRLKLEADIGEVAACARSSTLRKG